MAWNAILPLDIDKQREWSEKTFGPGERTEGIFDHMLKEMDEIREAENAGESSLAEWIDLVILALDGAWRSGSSSNVIIQALFEKWERNRNRVWPEWRTAEPGKAIEHDRSFD
jgi:hypothetical protein